MDRMGEVELAAGSQLLAASGELRRRLSDELFHLSKAVRPALAGMGEAIAACGPAQVRRSWAAAGALAALAAAADQQPSRLLHGVPAKRRSSIPRCPASALSQEWPTPALPLPAARVARPQAALEHARMMFDLRVMQEVKQQAEQQAASDPAMHERVERCKVRRARAASRRRRYRRRCRRKARHACAALRRRRRRRRRSSSSSSSSSSRRRRSSSSSRSRCCCCAVRAHRHAAAS